MARSGRPSGKMQADWVYRGNKFLLSGDLSLEEEPNFSGTYYAPFTMLGAAPGVPSPTGQVLYDSADYMGGRYGQDRDPASGEPRAYAIPPVARPDRTFGGALIHAVDLQMHLFLSAWASPQNLYLGWRIVVCEQDTETGQMLVHPQYSMWQDMGGLNAQPATWANGRQNCAEGRIIKTYGGNDGVSISIWYTRFLRFKRRLQANEGLFLYLELHPNSVAVGLINPFCRTLVTDARA